MGFGGLGDFFQSSAGAIGGIGGTAFGPIGAAFGTAIGGNIEGNYRNRKAREAAEANMSHQERLFNMQARLQREFARQGIQWRVEDAKKAGIHPLAALGANPIAASPVMVGDSGVPLQDHSSSMAEMGQGIARAIAAGRSQEERQLMDIQLDNAKIDNEMRRIALINERRSLGVGTAHGIAGQVKNKPAEVTSHAVGRPNIEAGSVTSTGFARTAGGGLTPIPSKDVKERIEDQLIPEMVWSGQNYLGPTFGSNKNKPPRKLLPKGYTDWEWSPMTFEWHPVKGKGKTPWQRAKRWIKKEWNSNKQKFRNSPQRHR